MEFEEIEELIYYNLSYNISIIETLQSINKPELESYFITKKKIEKKN